MKERRQERNETNTMARTSERAAPSLRSAGDATGRERANVAKKWKKASSSLGSSIWREIWARDVTPAAMSLSLSRRIPGWLFVDSVYPLQLGRWESVSFFFLSLILADSPLAFATTLASSDLPLFSGTSTTV
jgi:hypothetical protein